MEFTVTALLGGTTGGVTLHDVDFAQRWVFFLAIGQLTRQAHTIEHTFAACHLTGLAGCLTGARSFHDLAANDLGIVGTFLEVIAQSLGHDVFHRRTHFAGHQLVFGLAAELGFRHFHRQHAAQAFAHVIARHFDFGLFSELMFFDVLVDHAGHGRAQTRQMSAAITLRNVVGETQHILVVAIVPLHGDFHTNAGAWNAAVRFRRTFAFGIKSVGVQHLFARVDEVHKTFDATSTREVVFFAGAFVNQTDAHAVVQKAQFTQTFAQDFVMEICVLGEDFGVWQEVHFRTALLGFTCNAHG